MYEDISRYINITVLFTSKRRGNLKLLCIYLIIMKIFPTIIKISIKITMNLLMNIFFYYYHNKQFSFECGILLTQALKKLLFTLYFSHLVATGLNKILAMSHRIIEYLVNS